MATMPRSQIVNTKLSFYTFLVHLTLELAFSVSILVLAGGKIVSSLVLEYGHGYSTLV